MIAEYGYRGAPDAAPDYRDFLSHFPPLYPVTLKTVHAVSGITPAAAGMGISFFSILLASLFLHRLVMLDFGSERAAWLSVFFLNLFPTSYFTLAVYSESLFLLCTISAFYYGIDSQFRAGLSELGLLYVLGVQSTTSVWDPGHQPLPAKRWKGTGRPPRLLRRDKKHAPVSVKQLAAALPASAWKSVGWRQGSRRTLRSRFAAVRVRPAHRDYWQATPHPQEWLLIEWPQTETEPAKYWLSTLPADTELKELVTMAKQRWIIERDYEELKQELGLGHYEGRGWRGFHHHATLCIAAYGFLVAERNRFFPSARAGHLRLLSPELPADFRPRGSPHPPRAA